MQNGICIQIIKTEKNAVVIHSSHAPTSLGASVHQGPYTFAATNVFLKMIKLSCDSFYIM